MASNPNAPPESIIIQTFKGLNNCQSPERLTPGELSYALDVVLDDAGQLRTRPGFDKVNSSAHHSLTNEGGKTLVVRAGVLGLLGTGGSFTPLATVGADPLCYEAVGDVIYVSSVSWSGQISATNAVTTWGDDTDAGQWISPVINPTATLGAVAGRQFHAPPLAEIIESYKGRMYLAVGKVLWFTELYLYNQVDRTKNFVQFEDTITLVAAVGDGLYVGTEGGLFFLQGVAGEGLKRQSLTDGYVARGSVAWVPASKVHPVARSGQAVPDQQVPVFTTAQGIVVGLDGGTIYNLTQDRVRFPGVTDTAAIHRDEAGKSIYVVADAAGTAWAMNTRTGAVTEYGNYTFNGFARTADGWFGSAADGLYALSGADDDGTPLAATIRGGFMRFGGPRLSRLAGVYLSARSADTLSLTIQTERTASVYHVVAQPSLVTSKVHIGKGLRATYWNYELTAQELELDTIEFVPLVLSRRV